MEEFAITEIELRAIAAAAKIGLSNPKAAIGIPPELYANAFRLESSALSRRDDLHTLHAKSSFQQLAELTFQFWT